MTDVVYQTPRVGVAAWICHDGKVLMMQRKSAHGPGTWCPPGGHLEPGEHWFETAARETQEEVGLDIHSPMLFAVTNDLFPETGKHYITLHVAVLCDTPTFTNMEPAKHEHIDWYAWEDLPQPVFCDADKKLEQKPPYLEKD